MITIRCLCGKDLQTPPEIVGRSGTCPFCKAKIRAVAPGFDPNADSLDATLVIEEGPNRVGEQIHIGGAGPITIGKLPDNDCQLVSKGASRLHARLLRKGAGWRVEDNDSTNGLYVNDSRTISQALEIDNTIRIGEHLLRFAAQHANDAPKVPPRPAEQSPPAPAENDMTDDSDDAPVTDLLDDFAAAEDTSVTTTDAESDDELYTFADDDDEDETATSSQPPPIPAAQTRTEAEDDEDDEPFPCPSCETMLSPDARICINCGIDLRTKRVVVPDDDSDLDTVYATVETVVWWVSWFVWVGLYPIASEAWGARRAYTAWAILIVTCLTTFFVWYHDATNSPLMQDIKTYMHWTGNQPPTAERIAWYMQLKPEYGSEGALARAYSDVADGAALQTFLGPISQDPRLVDAHAQLTERQKFLADFHPRQLITHAFMHGSVSHLIGNMVFLIVIGTRINALLGHVATMSFYLLLAAASALIATAAHAGEPPTPAIGASGAIMGLCGMYLVLMPIHKVHLVAWLRPMVLFYMFRLYVKTFAARGFWVVLFYIAFDVVAVLLGTESNVGHWAHLGGFLAGACIGFTLLLTRSVNCRGTDLLSAAFGPAAWPFVGAPSVSRRGLFDKLP